MRKNSTRRENELNEIIEPYFVYKNGGYLKDNAPQEVKDAYEELLDIGKSEQEEMIRSFL